MGNKSKLIEMDEQKWGNRSISSQLANSFIPYSVVSDHWPVDPLSALQ
jgi:hypothetical protein